MSRLGSAFSPLMILLLVVAVVLVFVWGFLEGLNDDGPTWLLYLAMASALAVVFLSASRSRR